MMVLACFLRVVVNEKAECRLWTPANRTKASHLDDLGRNVAISCQMPEQGYVQPNVGGFAAA